MPIAEDSGLVLLLLFRDRLIEGGAKGFPLVTASDTLEKHIRISEEAPSPVTDVYPQDSQLSFAFLSEEPSPSEPRPSTVQIQDLSAVPEGCCVWGWWKKPWERNDELLNVFSQRCHSGIHTDVILYNQYLRMAFKANLHDLYFVREASKIEIPYRWLSKCPAYYATNPHQSGAFFVLEILRKAGSSPEDRRDYDPNELFKGLYVDELSFPLLRRPFLSVISPPHAIAEHCSNLVDRTPTQHELKATEHTVFALRKQTRKEITKQYLVEGASDATLSDALRRTERSDIKSLLFAGDTPQWAALFARPQSLYTIAARLGHPLIPFDLFLLAWFVSSSSIPDELIPQGEQHSTERRKLATAFLAWLTEEDHLRQRLAATRLYSAVWNLAAGRYALADLSGYFKSLPNLEEIAYSTQYGLRKKFYRDHLNHNIRAALLSAYLAAAFFPDPDESANFSLVAFLAGLFHDIAHPLASTGKVSAAISDALEKIRLPLRFQASDALLHAPRLHEILCMVSMIASIPSLYKKQLTHSLLPWNDRDSVIHLADQCLLFEEMACSMNNDHAVLSAAVLLNAAAYPSDSDKSHLREVLQSGSGSGRKKEGVEFLNLIQSISLHDRKSAAGSHGATEEQRGIPTPLSLHDFPLPTLTVIADELQEWGRPIADFSKTLVTDCVIGIEDNVLSAAYNLVIDSAAIGDTAYSVLEHFLAKVRTLSQLKLEHDITVDVHVSATVRGELRAVNCSIEDGMLMLCVEERTKVVWPYRHEDPQGGIYLTSERIFLGLQRGKDKSGETKVPVIADFVVLTFKGKLLRKVGDISAELKRQSLVSYMEVSVKPLTVAFATDRFEVSGSIARYYFTKLSKDETTVLEKNSVAFADNVSILEINVDNIRLISSYAETISITSRDLHLTPCPHFLDYDWRFSREAIYAIMRFIECHAATGNICYLGCPSLALYHKLFDGLKGKYALIDKGHSGIQQWVTMGLLDKGKVKYYDVVDPLARSLKHKFDMVIMDPPWYPKHYVKFWYRALELVRPGGIVGVAEYPGYKPKKLAEMEEARNTMVQQIGGKDYFASIEISYSPPPFETSWDAHLRYTHTAIGAYRPAYMDFYGIADPVTEAPQFDKETTEFLPLVQDFGSGHYIRYRNDIEMICSSTGISFFTRKDLDTDIENMDEIVAWDTLNTIAVVDKEHGRHYANVQVLFSALREWEEEAPK